MLSAKLLKDEIAEAFDSVQYPGDANIVSHHCPDCDEVAGILKGTRWQDWLKRPAKEMAVSGGPIFSVLTPEAFHYYLPTFLTISIDDFYRGNIGGAIIFSFVNPELQHQSLSKGGQKSTPPTAEKEQWYRNRMNGFTPSQLKAIRNYLHFIQEKYSADDPLGMTGLALKSIDGWAN